MSPAKKLPASDEICFRIDEIANPKEFKFDVEQNLFQRCASVMSVVSAPRLSDTVLLDLGCFEDLGNQELLWLAHPWTSQINMHFLVKTLTHLVICDPNSPRCWVELVWNLWAGMQKSTKECIAVGQIGLD